MRVLVKICADMVGYGIIQQRLWNKSDNKRLSVSLWYREIYVLYFSLYIIDTQSERHQLFKTIALLCGQLQKTFSVWLKPDKKKIKTKTTKEKIGDTLRPAHSLSPAFVPIKRSSTCRDEHCKRKTRSPQGSQQWNFSENVGTNR